MNLAFCFYGFFLVLAFMHLLLFAFCSCSCSYFSFALALIFGLLLRPLQHNVTFYAYCFNLTLIYPFSPLLLLQLGALFPLILKDSFNFPCHYVASNSGNFIVMPLNNGAITSRKTILAPHIGHLLGSLSPILATQSCQLRIFTSCTGS